MNKCIIWVIILLFFLLSHSVKAEPFNPRFPQPGCWFFDLGFTGYRYRYEERSSKNNSFFMRFTGPMYGFYYTLGYQPKCTDFRFALEGFLALGSDLYYKSAGAGTAKNDDFETFETRLLAFYPYLRDASRASVVEFYSGIGGRFLGNDGYDKVTSTGHVGYVRHSYYTYVPMGTRFITQFNCSYLITHLEYDWFIKGNQDSFLNGRIRNTQRKGMGMRAGLDLQFPSFFKCCDFLVGAFVRYWSIKDSTVNADNLGVLWLEPRNKTLEVGGRIGFVF